VPHTAPFDTVAKISEKLRYADGEIKVVLSETKLLGPFAVGVAVTVEPLPLQMSPETVVTGQ